ncbi:MAG: hypothetical protein JW750_05840, partial [Anaerolineaceae bacterium]|nr:hypothetical protein [Anaerolineaceae bacterium]
DYHRLAGKGFRRACPAEILFLNFPGGKHGESMSQPNKPSPQQYMKYVALPIARSAIPYDLSHIHLRRRMLR